MEDGKVIDIVMIEEMNKEIQVTTDKQYSLSMSAPVMISSPRKRLGFSFNTDFVPSMLEGKVHIPSNVDNVMTTIIEEFICLFWLLQEGHLECILGEDQFRYYWGKFKEKTSSSISFEHVGHYKTAIYSDMATNFLSQKMTLITRGGCPSEQWGHRLEVMLEKMAGVALVNKLHPILLMEADFNCINKWVFGYRAINKFFALGYIPGDQYSQKESTTEDARMDNRLTMDLS
jgi:hypothetical protein